MRFSRRRRKASSISQGKLVAPSTITVFVGSALGSEVPTPSIWVSNSDFTRREVSCSDSEPRFEPRESTLKSKVQSQKITSSRKHSVQQLTTTLCWLSRYIQSKQSRNYMFYLLCNYQSTTWYSYEVFKRSAQHHRYIFWSDAACHGQLLRASGWAGLQSMTETAQSEQAILLTESGGRVFFHGLVLVRSALSNWAIKSRYG